MPKRSKLGDSRRKNDRFEEVGEQVRICSTEKERKGA